MKFGFIAFVLCFCVAIASAQITTQQEEQIRYQVSELVKSANLTDAEAKIVSSCAIKKLNEKADSLSALKVEDLQKQYAQIALTCIWPYRHKLKNPANPIKTGNKKAVDCATQKANGFVKRNKKQPTIEQLQKMYEDCLDSFK